MREMKQRGKMEYSNYEELKNWLQGRILTWIRDYESMRNELFIKVCNAETNRDLLEQVPHTRYEDLAVTYHVRLDIPGEGITSVMLTHDIIRQSGFPADRIRGDAFRSSMKRFPVVVDTMENVLTSLLAEEEKGSGSFRDIGGSAPVLMVTNTVKFNGAAALFYPGVMDDVAERLGGDYYILPSSIHEVIAVPADGRRDWRGLERMVRNINHSQVAPAEQLSDHVYRYDAGACIFERADRF